MTVLLRSLFAASLAVLFFSYGVASVQRDIFPYPLVHDAQIAMAAWSDVLDGANPDIPLGLIGFEAAGTLPQATLTRAPDRVDADGLILVTGGPYQLLDRCPRFGCVAWLMNREGEILHGWEVDLGALWEETGGLAGRIDQATIDPVGLALFDNGDLAITFQSQRTFPYGMGIARIDAAGTILWKRIDFSHHWIAADDQGLIYVPGIRIVDSPLVIGGTAADIVCDTGKIYEDVIRVLSREGEVVREMSMVDVLASSDYAGLLHSTWDTCDPIHLNWVAVVSPAHAARLDGVEPGDLLISMRNINAVAILDGGGGRIKRLVAGRTVAQHSPNFLPDGRVLVFDNLGGARAWGGSRIVALDLESAALEVVFPRSANSVTPLLYSEMAGHLDISPDGRRALVAVTNQGRVIEIDLETGEVLWEYENTHDIAGLLDEAGVDQESKIGRFLVLGAQYVEQAPFLRTIQLAR